MMIVDPYRFAVAGGTSMSFVGGTKQSADGNLSSFAVSLESLTGGTASAPVEGDIVVVAVCTGGFGGNIDVSVTGYTEVADLYSDDNVDANLGVFYKVQGVTPDTSITVSAPSGSASFDVAVAVHVWSGVDQSTPIDVTSTTATGINGGKPYPPAITPVTSGAIILLAGGSGNASSSGEEFTASGTENMVTQNAVTGAVGLASVEWGGGAYTPAEWSGTTGTSSSWAAVTLALRPA